MQTSPRTMAVILAGIASLESAAANHTVEETIIGPADGPGIYAVAPNGGHIAFMAKKGARFTISVDGVEGPEVDEVLQAGWNKTVEFPADAVARSSGALFRNLNGTFAMDDDGTIAFIGVDRGFVRRYRITPTPEPGIAAMLARAKP